MADDVEGGFCSICEKEHSCLSKDASRLKYEGESIGSEVSATAKDDLAVIGIPCPLFSSLSSKAKGKDFNPFLEQLGSLDLFRNH